MMSQVDFKIILLGSQGVGKTAIFMRYIYSDFSTCPYKTTLGAVFGSKHVTSANSVFSIGIWDTAGSERFHSMTKLYYRNSRAAIVCYDPYSVESWERVKFWVMELNTREEDCKVYICQTKKDIVDTKAVRATVDVHDAQDYADSIRAPFFTVSSKTGENIDALFQKIVDDLSHDPKCMQQLREDKQRQQQELEIGAIRERIQLKERFNSSCSC